MVTPSSARPATSMPVIAPAFEGEFKVPRQRGRRGLRGAHIGANRHIMPMKPAAPDRSHRSGNRPPPACREVGQEARRSRCRPSRFVMVLALEIGLRALTHRSCDFLHPRIARVGFQNGERRPDGVNDRKRPGRAQSPIMLSLNAASDLVFLHPHATPRTRLTHKKEALPCPKRDGLHIGRGACQKPRPRCNAAKPNSVDFGRVFRRQ